MSILENALSADASANIFFSFEEETALLPTYIHPPLHFPKREKYVFKKITVFNTDDLTFEELQENEECGICFEDVNTKYLNQECVCNITVCEECITKRIRVNYEYEEYRKCPHCRRNTFIPRISRTEQNQLTETIPLTPTNEDIQKYKRELRVLTNMRDNHKYFTDNIDGKYFTEMTIEQQIYWNVASFYSEDINNSENHLLADRFYISGKSSYLERAECLDICANNILQTLTSRSYNLISRNDDSYSYYELIAHTETDVLDILSDYFVEDLFSFPRYFIYDYCLNPNFKKCLTDENDTILDAVYEDGNAEFLLQMLKPAEELKDVLKLHYRNLNLEEVIGYDHMENTTIKYYDEKTDEVKKDEVFLFFNVGPCYFSP